MERPARAPGVRPLLFLAGLLSFAGATAASCGSRTGLPYGPPRRLPQCLVDADCPGYEDKCRSIRCVAGEVDGGGTGSASTGVMGSTSTGSTSSASTGGAGGSALASGGGHCVEGAPVDCDDQDPCTIDTCEKKTGECQHAPATFDRDGDGHKGPLEGHKAGDPGSCGDDCNDSDPTVHPGATDLCGVDKDCDDDATVAGWSVVPGADRRISDHASAEPGGLAYGGKSYLSSFTEDNGKINGFTALLTDLGDKVPPGEQRITGAINADSEAGPVLWVGDRFGAVWSDRRFNAYDIFFSLFDDKGNKVHADQIVSQKGGTGGEFSIYPSLGWNGTHFFAVWQDDRLAPEHPDLYGQVLDVNANLVAGNVRLTNAGMDGFPNEAPAVASDSQHLGVAWDRGDAFTHFVEFQRFDFDFTPIGPTIDLTDGMNGAVYPSISINKDRYVVAWFERTGNPPAIYAAEIGFDGTVLVPRKALTSPPPGAHSRYPALRSLGNKTLLVYSDDRDHNSGYELYERILDNDLNPLTPETRITNAPGDSIYPTITIGPNGDMGVLFRDDRLGEQHVWFTHLTCVAGTTPP